MTTPERSLRWRCRRGMLELDVMLNRFLDHDYAALDSGGRAAFDRLLDMEDDRLWDWLSGRETPEEQGIAQIVQRIRGR